MIRMQATASEARVARRRRPQAKAGQLLLIAALLDQVGMLQRQALPGVFFDDGFEAQVVDAAIRLDGLAQVLRVNLRMSAAGQIDGAGGEIHGKRQQAGDDEEQQADGVHDGYRRIDPAADLAAPIGVKDRAAGGQLGNQGQAESTADECVWSAHGHQGVG